MVAKQKKLITVKKPKTKYTLILKNYTLSEKENRLCHRGGYSVSVSQVFVRCDLHVEIERL